MAAFFITILIAICVALILNSYEYSKSTMDNTGQLKTKLNEIEEKLKSGTNPLTTAGIAELINSLGWEHGVNGSEIRFSVSDEIYGIQTDRLPLVFILKGFRIEAKDWDIDRLRHAAHLMADEVVMVKARIDEDAEGIFLHFFVATHDANIESFSANLMAYLGIINEGESQLRAIYEKLGSESNGEDKGEEKDDEAPALNPSLNGNQRKVVS